MFGPPRTNQTHTLLRNQRNQEQLTLTNSLRYKPRSPPPMSISTSLFIPFPPFSPLQLHPRLCSSSTTTLSHCQPSLFLSFSSNPRGGGGGNINNNNNSGGGGGNDDNGEGKGGDDDNNMKEMMIMLAEAGISMESLPKDLAAAIQAGKVPGSVIERFLGLEKSGFIRWLMQFDVLNFKERLLADDLFLAKLGIECGVGIFTKTAAEYEHRRGNFFKEIEIVFGHVVMAIIADLVLVYLSAPTVSLRPPLAVSAAAIHKFFASCPDNAFQVALHGTSYSLLQRLVAVMSNGLELFEVGTTCSLIGTAATNALINARKSVDKSSVEEVENVPILSTSVAYGVYMAISSNLRYQVMAGVIEQRMLLAIRTGNTYLGSRLWVEFARLVGIQKAHQENPVLERFMFR